MVQNIPESFFSNKDLIKRFVSDLNLPINVLDIWHVFAYELMKYEDAYGSLTKWINLVDDINEEYHGDSNKWVDDYYKYRNIIITDMEANHQYQEWNKAQVKAPEFSPISPRYSSIWNHETCTSGKTYWSFDLKAANFQIFQHYGIIKEDTYREFLAKYIDKPCMLGWFANSKYTRQVIFGKLNAGKTTKLQKQWMQHIWEKYFAPMLPEGTKPVVITTDEFYIEEIDEPTWLRLQAMLLDPATKPPFTIVPKKVKPAGYEYFRYTPNNNIIKLGEFYFNELDNQKTRKYKCLDNTFAKIITSVMDPDNSGQYTKGYDDYVMLSKVPVIIQSFGGVSRITKQS